MTKYMRTIKAVVLLAGGIGLLAATPIPSAARDNTTKMHGSSSVPFGPLNRWRKAVLEGNQAELATFYSTTPPAVAEVSKKKMDDPAEEPLYWAGLKKEGLKTLDLKVLQMDQPKPRQTHIVFRIEGTLQTTSGVQPFVIGGSQIWSSESGTERIIYTRRSDLAKYVARTLPEPAKPNIHLYPPPEEAKPEIDAAIAAASRDHKRILLVFGGNWCYDCHVLNATFHSKSIAPLVDDNFHVVHVNIGEYDQNLDLAEKYNAPLKKGVPCLAVLDSTGKLLYTQKDGDFENTTRIGPSDVVTFLNRWKPTRGS